jgi:hypothetical protein
MESMDEFMFFKDRCITPTRWSIKLHHHGRSIFNADLIDPILIAVECKQAAIAMQPNGIERIEYRIGR